jgi:ubiquinone/menaquinone biosynthesis C-methylase UbiE
MSTTAETYALGHSDNELDRLSLQARAFEPLTRQLFVEAGIQPGMRVLDIGSGSGDVAFLAADLVGPAGQVVGFDQSSDAVRRANARAATTKLPNVQFVEGSVATPPPDSDFDAIVGRLVLMYLPDPADGLRSLLPKLRPGGLAVFHEFDTALLGAVPDTPLVRRVGEWILEALRRSGTELRMGRKLHATYVTAGLPAPQMRLDGVIGGSDSLGPALMCDVIRSLEQRVIALGIATETEIGIDTLEQRVREELRSASATFMLPPLIGAWSRTLA